MIKPELSSNKYIGKLGESIVSKYLEGNGYRIIELNYRTKFGEIDIIAKFPGGILLFVEVKTLKGEKDPMINLEAEDNLSTAKLRKFKRISQFFANANPELIMDAGWRMDLFAVYILANGRCKIRNYKNIV